MVANCIGDSNRTKRTCTMCVVVVVVVVALMNEMALVLKALVVYELDHPTPTIVKIGNSKVAHMKYTLAQTYQVT